MKKTLSVLIAMIVTLAVLVSCGTSEKKDINDFVTIKEVVNKEGLSPGGEKVIYIYEIPIINIDKPGAQKINDMFLNLEKDMEQRIGNGQNMTLFIPAKAFLNDGIISAVMEIKKGGPGGIHAINYDIETDKEIDTKELLEKYNFDRQRLIEEIDRQTKINADKPEEDRRFLGDMVSYFVETIITSDTYLSDDEIKMIEEMRGKTKEEQEEYVIENIDKIKVYMDQNGNFVFIHRGVLEDERLIIE